MKNREQRDQLHAQHTIEELTPTHPDKGNGTLNASWGLMGAKNWYVLEVLDGVSGRLVWRTSL